MIYLGSLENTEKGKGTVMLLCNNNNTHKSYSLQNLGMEVLGVARMTSCGFHHTPKGLGTTCCCFSAWHQCVVHGARLSSCEPLFWLKDQSAVSWLLCPQNPCWWCGLGSHYLIVSLLLYLNKPQRKKEDLTSTADLHLRLSSPKHVCHKNLFPLA